jgi:hypothetical protein
MTRTKKTKLHRRDYYYIIGAIGAIAAIAVVIALTTTPSEASGVVAHGERVVYHNHAVIEYYVDGLKQTVPSDIGVPIPENHPLAKYGPAGFSPIHTHDSTGIIHLESKEQRSYTFGDFLDLWGLDLSGNSASLFVNNRPVVDINGHVVQDQDVLRLEVITAGYMVP